MFKPKEKRERALGTKLFLKASRCLSPKCAMIRRPSKPGMHGKRKGNRSAGSEFGRQLQEKQKVQFTYGLNNRQMCRLFRGQKEVAKVQEILERRLDNVIFRLSLADSRAIARQLISHGHFLVRSRKVTIPSYKLKIGEPVSLDPNSRKLKIFEGLDLKLKKIDLPLWLKLDKEKLSGELIAPPRDLNLPFDLNLVVEYYSK